MRFRLKYRHSMQALMLLIVKGFDNTWFNSNILKRESRASVCTSDTTKRRTTASLLVYVTVLLRRLDTQILVLGHQLQPSIPIEDSL